MVKALDARDARVQWLQTRAVAALGVSEAEFGEALYDDDGCEAIRCVRVRGARPPPPTSLRRAPGPVRHPIYPHAGGPPLTWRSHPPSAAPPPAGCAAARRGRLRGGVWGALVLKAGAASRARVRARGGGAAAAAPLARYCGL